MCWLYRVSLSTYLNLIIIFQNLAEILSDRETIAHIMQSSLGIILTHSLYSTHAFFLHCPKSNQNFRDIT